METRVVEIAERIKGLREMMDITPEEMAEAAGVELEEYLKHESGEQDVDLRQSSGHPGCQHFTAVHNALGDARIIHKYTSTYKKGDCQERESLCAAYGLLGKYGEIHSGRSDKVNG